MPGGARAIGTVAEPRADSAGTDPAPRDAPRRVRGSWNQSSRGRSPVSGATDGARLGQTAGGWRPGLSLWQALDHVRLLARLHHPEAARLAFERGGVAQLLA